ncbi:EAL domain-containing protein [Microbacterium trichothecenolyticum]|uniref:EAL domain-containing protein n=1 Tax=Microbacterium trichothecenolyticum TaxID=69370 RepID=UPI001C6DE3D3|nr:EAL domain-containing protein [Microbacterium trichothecenolyticum]MBW9119717.1 EAL domain-containing protein [Microbacterium trichothecenolyticum]
MVRPPQLTRDLRAALSSGELWIAFQPQYDLDPTGPADAEVAADPVAVEALCRWNHALLGAVRPDTFIPLAEEGRFLDEIDLHVFARATEQVTRWRESGHPLGLSVNASPAHFSTRYADTIVARLDRLGIDPAGMTVEITEAPTPQLRPEMITAMQALRAVGIAISVDDYAGGDATVAMLEGLPIDEVKIDRSLTQRDDAEAHDAVAAVVESSGRHGWRVVAEGIETVADLRRSRERGCGLGQGYLWGLPMPSEEIDALLAAV